MERNQITLEELALLLSAQSGSARIKALVSRTGDNDGLLVHADITIGLPGDHAPDRRWDYEDFVFVESYVTCGELAAVVSTGKPHVLQLAEFSIIAEWQFEQFPCERRRSLDQYDLGATEWPSFICSLTIALSQQLQQMPPGYLIGRNAESFSHFAQAFGAFFHGNYALSGVSNAPLGKASLRFLDTRGRIKSVTIHPTQLEVEIDGAQLTGSHLELMAVSDRFETAAESSGSIFIPLPNGLPDDSWLWLKCDGDWLDYRGIGGWPVHRSADVHDARPSNSDADIAVMIAQGEGLHVEFKRQLPENNRSSRTTVFKTIVAFANGEGGVMLFGVDDDGSIIGIEGASLEVADRLLNMLRASTRPMPSCECTIEQIGGKSLLVVEVASTNGTVHALTVEADKPEYYVRRGATTFPAQPEEMYATAHAGDRPAPMNYYT